MAAAPSTMASWCTRLREGKRITIDTLERIQAYVRGGVPPPRGPRLKLRPRSATPVGDFRFFENRHEKRVERVVGSIHPRPALRLLVSATGVLLARVMMESSPSFPHMRFLYRWKRISIWRMSG